MKLYLMRHGHAEPGYGIADEDRALTDVGVERVRNAAHVLAQIGIAPAHIYSSPRLRAKQTAQIVADALGQTVEVHEAVNFGFDLAAIRDFIAATNGEEVDLMFVGHEPTLSNMIAALSQGTVVMKPGSFARIDVTSRLSPSGDLVWLIAPKVFDALASG